MDRQQELELIEKAKAFLNDDESLQQAAEIFHEKLGDDFKFKLQSAAWDALGDMPDSIGGKKPELQTKAPPREAAALLFAGQMRCLENRCPHVNPQKPVALHAFLAPRVLTCKECIPAYAKRFGTEPAAIGECDLCLRQGVKEFRQFNIAWQGVVYSGDICPDCNVLLTKERS